jgi:hypothetical protein
MNGRRILVMGAVVVAGLALAGAVVVVGRDKVLPEMRRQQLARDYPAAADCATCHADIAAEWRLSSHARAADDPLIHASNCGRCHAPVGVQLDPLYMFLKPTGDVPAHLPPSAAEGVTCVACHTAAHAPAEQVLPYTPEWPNWRPDALALSLTPFRTARGPFGAGTSDDPAPVGNASHASALDTTVSQSEACRPCHEVVTDKTALAGQLGEPQARVPLLTTYSEWSGSSYGGTSRTCQNCHMPRQAEPAPAAAAPAGVTFGAPLPPRVRTDHTFAGLGTGYWLPAEERLHQEALAAARLRGTAAVSLALPAAVAPGAAFDVAATVRNVGAGHDLPTGLASWRDMWLQLTVTDAAGRTVYESGEVDDQGWLRDEYSPAVRADPGRYDPYLVQLRPRLVSAKGHIAEWLGADGMLHVPASVVPRNRNGTPILSWAEYDAAPIVRQVVGPEAPGAAAPTGLRDEYTLRYADAVLREGIPALGQRTAHYPVTVPADAHGPLTVAARLVARGSARYMVAQQEEIRDNPPIKPIYTLGEAIGTVPIASP